MIKTAKLVLIIIGVIFFNSCQDQRKSVVYKTGFESFDNAMVKDIATSDVRWFAADNMAEVTDKPKSRTGKFMRIFPGENKSVTMELSSPEHIVSLSFKARAYNLPNFKFRVETFSNNNWIEIYNGDEEVVAKNDTVSVKIEVDRRVTKFRFKASSKEMGVFIDDLVVYREAISNIKAMTSRQPLLPVFKLKENNRVLDLKIEVDGNLNPLRVSSIDFNLEGTTDIDDINKLQLYYSEIPDQIENEKLFGKSDVVNEKFSITGNQQLKTGENYFWLSATLNNDADLMNKIAVNCVSVTLSNGETIEPLIESISRPQRIGVAVRQAGQDSVKTYRIPGLATTNKGTLIGVYDIRHKQTADLQGDIDIGMSRSTDGGNTWEPMKIILDMGEYGGKPQDENGIGDPSILIDRTNNTIWVAGVWAHGHPGKRNWWASKQGIKPENTSQFIITKSEDDGITWSDPINITSQIKDKDWFLLLQGPGKGIALKNGTLVFPAQFKDKEQVPHSTIIYSKDHGKTWKIWTGAKSNTTEAQVVELNDGSLMLNMRDNRKGYRSVYITKDLGATWEMHPTSRKVLKEPVCMASLISFDHPKKGQILFFSNPNNSKERKNITIKTSFDQGLTWPIKNQLELYENSCYGYSCMTKIDENHIGILYEGFSEIYFEKINLKELF